MAETITPPAGGPEPVKQAHDPVAPVDPGTRPLHSRGDFHARPNTWKWQAKDKDGKFVEFYPGMTWCTMRGPTTRAELITRANQLLYNASVEATTNGEPDPGFKLIEESITPLKPDGAPFGQFKPAGAAPLTLGVGKSYPEPPDDEDGV